jgi:hypothetical protein
MNGQSLCLEDSKICLKSNKYRICSEMALMDPRVQMLSWQVWFEPELLLGILRQVEVARCHLGCLEVPSATACSKLNFVRF